MSAIFRVIERTVSTSPLPMRVAGAAGARPPLLARVLMSVVVMPVPRGASDKAPFDPTLLKVSWGKDTTAAKSKGETGVKAPAQGPSR